VSQVDPLGRAVSAATQIAERGIGDYNIVATADTYPGGVVTVQVNWEVPNFYASLMPLFGVESRPLRGMAVSSFRKEGW
ncbi:MAG: hypothetical protein N2439_01690, partial [Anaerolineae bacterium]|nr:hypothetical protein [Anaerolineae bacterium]